MRELAGKTAFVTGGARGIGFALGRALLQRGMKVILADIEAKSLETAVKSLENTGPDVRGMGHDWRLTRRANFAVVAISEVLATQLKSLSVGVSVLCPEFVRTRIHESGRNRPEAMALPTSPSREAREP